MERYLIKDDTVIDLLIKNGFICKKPEYNSDAQIHFFTQSQEEVDKSRWYETDCPVEFNTQYTLPDKTIIQSCGTILEVLE